MLADPTTYTPHRREPGVRPVALAVSIAAVSVIALIGRRWTETSDGSWYDTLDKPAWTPPGVTFGIVWTLLYVAMAVAAWLVWRQGPDRADVWRAIGAHAVQLVLNLGWTATFFAAERPGWAVVEIVALDVAVAVTMVLFWRIDGRAGWLFAPYLGWVLYATTLTIGIAALN